MKTRTHFTFRVDTWTIDGESIVEHVAGVEDYQVALATFTARLRTLAWRPHHHAAGRASDRGQPPPARGVETSNRAGGGEPPGAPNVFPSGALITISFVRHR